MLLLIFSFVFVRNIGEMEIVVVISIAVGSHKTTRHIYIKHRTARRLRWDRIFTGCDIATATKGQKARALTTLTSYKQSLEHEFDFLSLRFVGSAAKLIICYIRHTQQHSHTQPYTAHTRYVYWLIFLFPSNVEVVVHRVMRWATCKRL